MWLWVQFLIHVHQENSHSHRSPYGNAPLTVEQITVRGYPREAGCQTRAQAQTLADASRKEGKLFENSEWEVSLTPVLFCRLGQLASQMRQSDGVAVQVVQDGAHGLGRCLETGSGDRADLVVDSLHCFLIRWKIRAQDRVHDCLWRQALLAANLGG